jgi:hypothetical protein
MPPPPPGTPVRSNAELAEVWRGLMGPGGFGTTSLWIVFLDDDGCLTPVIVPVDDLPDEPDDLSMRNLGRLIGQLLRDLAAASVALLLSRPGPRAMTEADRRWARALRTAVDGLPAWPVHLATRGHIQVFAPDDLVVAS